MKASRNGPLSPRQGGCFANHTQRLSPKKNASSPRNGILTGPSRQRPTSPPGKRKKKKDAGKGSRCEVSRARGLVSRREKQPELRGPQREGRASLRNRGAGGGLPSLTRYEDRTFTILLFRHFHHGGFHQESRQEYIVLARKQTTKTSKPGVPLRLAGRPRHARRVRLAVRRRRGPPRWPPSRGRGAARAAGHPGIRTRGGRGPTGQSQGTKPPRFPPPPLGDATPRTESPANGRQGGAMSARRGAAPHIPGPLSSHIAQERHDDPAHSGSRLRLVTSASCG